MTERAGGHEYPPEQELRAFERALLRARGPVPPGNPCPIGWQPSALTPVFYGIRDYDAAQGAPSTVRVFFPSLDGAVFDAAILRGCGRYPLILFAHGDCHDGGQDDPNHYRRWFVLAAQLARSGYVVAVPQLPAIGSHPSITNHPAQRTLSDTLRWIREGWEHREVLLPPPATGLAGHSFGALHAGILATSTPVSAVAHLSGGWIDWPDAVGPRPIARLTVPQLFLWGTDPGSERDAMLTDSLWNQVAKPKHRVVYAGGQHWDYLYTENIPCAQSRGPCRHVGAATADLITMFFAKYLPPELWPNLPDQVPDNLIPPPLVLTPEQEFYAGGHLLGWEAFNSTPTCSATIEPQHVVDRSSEFNTPPAAGAPTGFAVAGLAAHVIAYRDTSGHLHELWRRDATGATGTTDLTANAGAPSASGNPFGYVDTRRNTVILLYRGGDGTVRSLYWSTGSVGHDNLGGTARAPKADSDPVGYYTAGADLNHVIYRTSDGHLHELWWAGVAPVAHGGDLTVAANAPSAVGQPSAFVNGSGDNIVVYRSNDRHIRSLYWLSRPVGHDDLSGFAGTPPAAADPVAYYTPHDDTHQVVYPGNDGHLWELYWPGVAPVVGWDLTAHAGGPAAVGTPAAYYSAGTNTKHVIYRSADGRLHEIWWTPGGGTPAHVDLTQTYGAPPGADRPAAFTVEGPNTQHVAYRGRDNHIYEVLWS